MKAQTSCASMTNCLEEGQPTVDFWASSIPEEYRNIRLEDCKELPQKLVAFGEEWVRKVPFKSLYLYGQYGCGKTTFAFALIRKLLEKIKGCGYFWPSYLSARQLDTRLLKASKREDTDQEEIERLIALDLLFIDDIDKISASERFKLQFFEIIDGRLKNKKPTIITSNCMPTELGNLLDGAVISRIGNTAKWDMIKFPLKDLRLTQNANSTKFN